MIDESADSDRANLKAVSPFTGVWIEISDIQENNSKEIDIYDKGRSSNGSSEEDEH